MNKKKLLSFSYRATFIVLGESHKDRNSALYIKPSIVSDAQILQAYNYITDSESNTCALYELQSNKKHQSCFIIQVHRFTICFTYSLKKS